MLWLFLRNNWFSNEITISFVLMMEVFIIKQRAKKKILKKAKSLKKGQKTNINCTFFTYYISIRSMKQFTSILIRGYLEEKKMTKYNMYFHEIFEYFQGKIMSFIRPNKWPCWVRASQRLPSWCKSAVTRLPRPQDVESKPRDVLTDKIHWIEK